MNWSMVYCFGDREEGRAAVVGFVAGAGADSETAGASTKVASAKDNLDQDGIEPPDDA
ncbi:hypothetical protein [Pyxidicoccus fallax]|uniref:hypothetical protein n=1 Tax=Pyxidicoccus fallax TaxID=394095 RepID=UPI001FE31049|nr:hypothetical protein [Pyxidicoccus fallax]